MIKDYSNFVRAEVNSGGRLEYVWKCKNCGEEFRRTQNKYIRGLCDYCLMVYNEQKKAKATRKIEVASYKRIIRQIKKRVKVDELPIVSVNGDIFCQRKAFEDALDEILNDCLKDGE